MLAQLKDFSLYFDVVGSGLDAPDPDLKPKPVLIALSGGYGFDHAYLRLGLDDLSDQYQIIYADMRGQGRSSAVKLSSVQFDTMADDVAALMDLIGIPSAFVFGHASGSYIAQKIALRHPEKVNGLVLVSSSLGMTVLPSGVYKDYPTPFLKDRVQGDLLDVAHNFFFNPNAISDEDFQYYSHQVGPYYMAPDNMDQFEGLFRLISYKMDLVNHFRNINLFFNSDGKVNQITCPVLVMAGTFDWASPAVGSKMLNDKLTNSEFIEFGESGHFPFIEEHDKFTDLLAEFILKNRTPS